MPETLKTHELSDSFINILTQVVEDPDYLVGAEPDGSGWDFSNWPGFDFQKFNDWVLREKFFSIPSLDRGNLALRIVQTDPRQFHIDIESQKVGVSFLINPVNAKDFPIIFIGENDEKEEVVIRHKTNTLLLSKIPPYFQDLAREMGMIGRASTEISEEADQWAKFLRLALQEKKVLPTHYGPTDFMVRDRLELSKDEPITDEIKLLAEMQITQQELLMYAFADFIIS